MSGSKLRKCLPPHAVTCIKTKIAQCLEDSDNAGLAYNVYCDREDCWSCTELIAGQMCAVNVRENGFSLTGSEEHIRLSDGTSVCAQRAILDIQIQVFASGCKGTIDIAMSVLADVMAVLNNTSASKFCAKTLLEADSIRSVDTDYADQKTQIIHNLQIQFNYVPSRPSLVFGVA